jgi:hypothetical protein
MCRVPGSNAFGRAAKIELFFAADAQLLFPMGVPD